MTERKKKVDYFKLVFLVKKKNKIFVQYHINKFSMKQMNSNSHDLTIWALVVVSIVF